MDFFLPLSFLLSKCLWIHHHTAFLHRREKSWMKRSRHNFQFHFLSDYAAVSYSGKANEKLLSAEQSVWLSSHWALCNIFPLVSPSFMSQPKFSITQSSNESAHAGASSKNTLSHLLWQQNPIHSWGCTQIFLLWSPQWPLPSLTCISPPHTPFPPATCVLRTPTLHTPVSSSSSAAPPQLPASSLMAKTQVTHLYYPRAYQMLIIC